MGYFESRKGGGLKVVTWADGTDEEIAAMLEAHYNGDINIYDYWTVGDKRDVELTPIQGPPYPHILQQTVTLILSNKGGKTLADGVTECVFQVDQEPVILTSSRMNSTKTNSGGWKNCLLRTWCNDMYVNAIPSTLKPIFKDFINTTGVGGGVSTGTENTTDTFALRSEIEVFGSTTYSFSGEGTQIKLYETTSNRKKIYPGESGGVKWWERSPQKGNNWRFCMVNLSGDADYNEANSNAYLSPFGCI